MVSSPTVRCTVRLVYRSSWERWRQDNITRPKAAGYVVSWIAYLLPLWIKSLLQVAVFAWGSLWYTRVSLLLAYWYQWFASCPSHRNWVPFGALTSPVVVVTVHAGSCCVQIMRPCRSAPVPGAQSLSHGWLHMQPGLSRFRPGHAGRCWPGAGKSKKRTHAWWRTLLTVLSHHVPCCGSTTRADLQHHSILRTFRSFLLHSVGCREMEALTQSHYCATRLTARQLRVQGLQPEALPNKASFALGFS